MADFLQESGRAYATKLCRSYVTSVILTASDFYPCLEATVRSLAIVILL